jgi:hypothetical protein
MWAPFKLLDMERIINVSILHDYKNTLRKIMRIYKENIKRTKEILDRLK